MQIHLAHDWDDEDQITKAFSTEDKAVDWLFKRIWPRYCARLASLGTTEGDEVRKQAFDGRAIIEHWAEISGDSSFVETLTLDEG